MKRILQITPYLPPTISGVGDYALILARGLRERHGLQTTFAVAHPPAERPDEIEGFPVIPLPAHTPGALAATLDGFDRVLLQYVGYGYQKRGCPTWLPQGLARWRRTGREHKLTTMFHELHASGPPWKSSFWTAPVQRRICFDLARLSDRTTTNREASQRELKRHGNTRAVSHPVFSNVGELHEPPPLQERSRQMIVFGGGPRFDQALRQQHQTLAGFIIEQEVSRIVTVGKVSGSFTDLPTQVDHAGSLDAASIHLLLARSRYGLLNYFPGYLGKSGVFASYCAHGLLPILLNRDDTGTDGLIQGEHFMHLGQAARCPSGSTQAVADAAWNWYQRHSVRQTVDSYFSILS